MDFSFAKLSELTPNVIAAVGGALLTLTAALINLRIAWRREVLARLEKPRGGKAKRGLLLAIGFMVAAAGVGGYALALYLMQSRESDIALLRADLRRRADQIQSSAERIENARTLERYSALADARLAEERRRGAEGVAAAARLAPCRMASRPSVDAAAAAPLVSVASVTSVAPAASAAPAPVAAAPASSVVAAPLVAGADAACREADAPHSSVCAVLPARAVPLEIAVAAAFTAADGSASHKPVALGADLGTARLAAAPVERGHSDGKLLCLDAWSWDAQRSLDVRILVRYLLGDVLVPVAGTPEKQAGS